MLSPLGGAVTVISGKNIGIYREGDGEIYRDILIYRAYVMLYPN
jgi:hypothetical protein